VRSGFAANGEWQVSAEVAYAPTDWWELAAIAEWESASTSSIPAFAVESVFDFAFTRDWPIHVGAYVEYEVQQAAPNELQINLLLERERGPLDLQLNIIALRALTAGEDWEFSYVAQASVALNDALSFGIQGIGDAGTSGDFGHLGDRAQYWGPFAVFEAGRINGGDIEVQIGYLIGSSEAESDGLFRFTVGYEFGGSDSDS
jgi:hypothetical protein